MSEISECFIKVQDKVMKNILKLSFVMLAAAFVFGSCSDDGYSVNNLSWGYGTVVSAYEAGTTTDFAIELDGGSRLVILENTISNVMVKSGDRVRAYFSVWGDDKREDGTMIYYVRLNGLDMITSKEPILQSIIDENEALDQELGDDVIEIDGIKSSGRYINVYYSYPSTLRPAEPHIINLAHNDIETEDGRVVLTFRHNGFDDVVTEEEHTGFYLYEGMMSFDLLSLVPAEGGEVDVLFKWIEHGDRKQDGWWNERVEKTMTGTFKYYPAGSNSSDKTAPESEISANPILY